ncbi:MAG TPA: molybdopterin-dependent oxidoreductase [Gemmatimonadales bacterium]|nr:molybdopterin-dependent oxidoreductase [Gemmatimonadales bacterium]
MADETDQTSINRRRFLTVLGASGAGAALLSGCSTERVQQLIPYLVQSEDQIPGIATYYASTCTECAGGCGLHVRTREGRAVKLEGNPEHPVNRGKLCSRGQAALQGLYNPGRVKAPMARNATGGFSEITWDDAIGRLAAKLAGAAGKVAVISGAGRGTFSDLLAEWTAALGGRVVRYQPFDEEPLRAANRAVFGRDDVPAHDFSRAQYVVAFGTDFLETWLSPVENSRGFADAHGFRDGRMSKLVFFGPRAPLTGLNADEWYLVPPGSETTIALALANVVATEGKGAPAGADGLAATIAEFTPEMAARESGVSADVIRRVGRELAAARPSLAVAGGAGNQYRAAVETCTAANVLNYLAGNVGETVRFGADLQAADGHAAINSLAQALDAGQVSVLLVHETNPLYTLPQASGFAARFKQAAFKVSTSLYLDETAAQCDLLLPNHHALERWDDAHPRAAVYGLMQPVMEPVFQTMHTGDVLLAVARKAGGPLAKFGAPTFEAHLKSRWQTLAAEQHAGDAESFWRESLRRGGLYLEPPPVPEVRLAANVTPAYTRLPAPGAGDFYLVPGVSPLLYDGRGTNKPWLLENPDPVTKLTWNSWIEIHPTTARQLDIRNGEFLRLRTPQGAVEAPVLLYPGVHPRVLSTPFGFGHTAYGAYASGRGINVLDLVPAAPDDPFVTFAGLTVSVEKTRAYRKLATTEGTPRQLGRGIAEAMTLAAAQRGETIHQALVAEHRAEPEPNTEGELRAIKGWAAEVHARTLLGNYAGDHPMWGMAIDLSRCTGCTACITACYAENNIPTVGEDEIWRGREMTWLRLERYWEGAFADSPAGGLEARFVPMLCQQCGSAPCESVCPVYAAYHTVDGLNGQVYNRCVGTRYCANNCPYKVRYFNWYKYNDEAWPAPLNLQLNPDVTVRARGVMEKCTFCVQRIRGAQNEVRLESRTLKEGDVNTACAQACPSDAIVFGNLRDPDSRVYALSQDRRGYHVLESLNTRPAITYLAKVRRAAEA